MERILLSDKETSKIVGLKKTTLQGRRQLGLPPRFLKVGSKVYYDKKDIDAFLDSCVRESTSQSKGSEGDSPSK